MNAKKDGRKSTRRSTAPEVTSSEEIIAALPDLILELDSEGVYVAYHSGNQEKLYRSPEHLLGRHFREVLPQSVSSQIAPAFEKAVETKVAQEISYIINYGEELRYFETRISPLGSGNVLAIIQDRTESWRARTELQQSEEQFRALVQNIPGVVYRCEINEDWTAVYISDATEDIYGYPAEDFLAGRVTLGSLLHPEDAPRLLPAVQRAVKENRPFDLNYRIINRAGKVRVLHERGRPVFAEFKKADYIDGVIFDITEMHQMRQRVMINHKMAAVGNLAAGVAHEINNPLAIAMANLEYMAEEIDALRSSDDAEQSETLSSALEDISSAISKIRHSTDRVRNIVDDLRAFTDAAEGRPHNLDLQRLLIWSVQRFESRKSHLPEVKMHLEEVAPIWASEVGVVQVLWNLLENAFDAVAEMETEREPSIEIFLTQQTDQILIRMTDNGPGMSEEVTRRAFEPFFTTKPVGQGAGLGLFVCQGLLEGMDSTIEIKSQPGEGTEVTISFPALSNS